MIVSCSPITIANCFMQTVHKLWGDFKISDAESDRIYDFKEFEFTEASDGFFVVAKNTHSLQRNLDFAKFLFRGLPSSLHMYFYKLKDMPFEAHISRKDANIYGSVLKDDQHTFIVVKNLHHVAIRSSTPKRDPEFHQRLVNDFANRLLNYEAIDTCSGFQSTQL